MKTKKFLLINIAVLVLNILLISLSVIRLPGSFCCFGQSYGFHPVKIEAPHFSYVGQLRFFKDGQEFRSGLWGGEIAELEFCGIDRAAPGEEFDIVRIKETLKYQTCRLTNFAVMRFCPEDGYWYIIYYPNYAERAVAIPQGPGTSVAQYRVPPGLIEEPGTYAIGTKERGYCKFEIE